MKRIALFLLVCVAFSVLTSAAQRKIAYEHRDNIFVADTDGTHQKKVAAGALPEISPDGTRVAFNTDEDSKTRPGPERHIAIADLGTGKVRILKEIPSDNCFGPVWSPDGSKLAFSIMAEKEWRLGLVNADGSAFGFVKNAALKSDAFGAPTWSADGKSIFCYDLDNLYHIDLDGNVLKKWELSKLLTETGAGSGDQLSGLSMSPDGKTLLMDINLGGPEAIFVVDLGTEKTTRVTSKEDVAVESCWLTNDEFLCVIFRDKKRGNEKWSVYRISVSEKTVKLLIK